MTAFAIEATLLLVLAFLLALSAGYWLARRRASEAGARSGAAGEGKPEGPAAVPATPVRAVSAQGGAGQDAPVQEAPTQPAGAPAQGKTGEATAASGQASPPPAPAEPDLFSRFGIVNGTVTLPLDDDEPDPRPASRRRPQDRHPGVRPPTLAAPEGEGADDLKLLRGIGPQNEGRLNALGIFHFRQIAAWTPEEAAWVGSYLAFPGRIEREDWIGQAKAILEGGPPPPGRRKR